ncbi:ABC transporter ATP-binding protein [Arthrobacter crystallopoietes]|uniref:ABC-type quaternary amine transporter n=1 Tax=Crystallibacter crystallopoietes TaxID=37928 RepID=A0A1H1FTP2_9MICC|nr:ABC transporter ATP-binding protein [Arthrobacter crystallopoietes]AUI52923.1 ABC transporter [Arthrobacter crystallopoietes]SDR04230.1 iron(III) transport system ATP-binding protein [Arthrobacter crystallopoietes]
MNMGSALGFLTRRTAANDQSTPALVLEGAAKHYGTTPAIDSLYLTAAPGELITMIGPSGCGKSTALRLIAGLERPDAGSVRIAGEVVAGRTRFQPPERRRVGLVFQDHALFPHLTVAQNVAFGLHRSPRSGRRARVSEVLELVRLPHLAGRYPHELSGGEAQRVALARALAPQPAVVLLDEPFSSLDESLRAQVRADTVAVLRETGTTGILVTHDQTEALSVGDRVIVMRNGRMEQVDTPERVFEQPATRFVASFMGDADFLPAHVHNAVLTCEIGAVSTLPGWAGADVDVDVVLRPHEVALAADPASAARVVAVEYHGPFVLHTVRLASGRTVRSWQPHTVRHPVGTAVAVTVAPDTEPTLLAGDTAITSPPATGSRVKRKGTSATVPQ